MFLCIGTRIEKWGVGGPYLHSKVPGEQGVLILMLVGTGHGVGGVQQG